MSVLNEQKLVSSLTAPSHQDRIQGLDTLRKTFETNNGPIFLADPAGFYQLVALALADSNWNVKREAITACQAMLPLMPQAATYVLPNLVANLIDAKVTIRKATVAALEHWLAHTSTDLEKAYELLDKRALQHQNPRIRESILSVLGSDRSPARASVAALVKLLAGVAKRVLDSDNETKEAAKQALVAIQAQSAHGSFAHSVEKLPVGLRQRLQEAIKTTKSSVGTPAHRNEATVGNQDVSWREDSSLVSVALVPSKDAAFGIIPASIVNSLKAPETSLQVKLQHVEAIGAIVNNQENAAAILPHLEPFTAFVAETLTNPNIRVKIATLNMFESLLKSLGWQSRSSLDMMFNMLVTVLADTKIVVRNNATKLVTTLMHILTPSPVIHALAAHITNSSWRIREEIVNIIIIALSTFSGDSFDYEALANVLAPALSDRKQRVALVAVEACAVLGSLIGNEEVIRLMSARSVKKSTMNQLVERLENTAELPTVTEDGTLRRATSNLSSIPPTPTTNTSGLSSLQSRPVSGVFARTLNHNASLKRMPWMTPPSSANYNGSLSGHNHSKFAALTDDPTDAANRSFSPSAMSDYDAHSLSPSPKLSASQQGTSPSKPEKSGSYSAMFLSKINKSKTTTSTSSSSYASWAAASTKKLRSISSTALDASYVPSSGPSRGEKLHAPPKEGVPFIKSKVVRSGSIPRNGKDRHSLPKTRSTAHPDPFQSLLGFIDEDNGKQGTSRTNSGSSTTSTRSRGKKLQKSSVSESALSSRLSKPGPGSGRASPRAKVALNHAGNGALSRKPGSVVSSRDGSPIDPRVSPREESAYHQSKLMPPSPQPSKSRSPTRQSRIAGPKNAHSRSSPSSPRKSNFGGKRSPQASNTSSVANSRNGTPTVSAHQNHVARKSGSGPTAREGSESSFSRQSTLTQPSEHAVQKRERSNMRGDSSKTKPDHRKLDNHERDDEEDEPDVIELSAPKVKSNLLGLKKTSSLAHKIAKENSSSRMGREGGVGSPVSKEPRAHQSPQPHPPSGKKPSGTRRGHRGTEAHGHQSASKAQHSRAPAPPEAPKPKSPNPMASPSPSPNHRGRSIPSSPQTLPPTSQQVAPDDPEVLGIPRGRQIPRSPPTTASRAQPTHDAPDDTHSQHATTSMPSSRQQPLPPHHDQRPLSKPTATQQQRMGANTSKPQTTPDHRPPVAPSSARHLSEESETGNNTRSKALQSTSRQSPEEAQRSAQSVQGSFSSTPSSHQATPEPHQREVFLSPDPDEVAPLDADSPAVQQSLSRSHQSKRSSVSKKGSFKKRDRASKSPTEPESPMSSAPSSRKNSSSMGTPTPLAKTRSSRRVAASTRNRPSKDSGSSDDPNLVDISQLPPLPQARLDDLWKKVKEELARGNVQETWMDKCKALVTIRQLIRDEPDYVVANLGSVSKAIVEEVGNLRSLVSRVAILSSSDLFRLINRDMEKALEPMTQALVTKSAESSSFIKAECEAALLDMVDSVSPYKAIAVLLVHAQQKNKEIRRVVTRCLMAAVRRAGPRLLAHKDASSVFIHLQKLLRDQDQETRYHAREVTNEIMMFDGYEDAARKHLDGRVLSDFLDACKAIEKRGVGDMPLTKTVRSTQARGLKSSRAKSSRSGTLASLSPDDALLATQDAASPNTPPTQSRGSRSTAPSARKSARRQGMSGRQKSSLASASPFKTRDGQDLLKVISDELKDSDWKTREAAIRKLLELVQSAPEKFTGTAINVFFDYAARLQDSNSKVGVLALQVVAEIFPLLGDELELALTELLQSLSLGLASTNGTVKRLTQEAHALAVSSISPQVLLPPLANVMVNANSVIKGSLLLYLKEVVPSAYEVNPKLVSRYIIPSLVKVFADTKVQQKTRDLWSTLFSLMGEDLFSHRAMQGKMASSVRKMLK